MAMRDVLQTRFGAALRRIAAKRPTFVDSLWARPERILSAGGQTLDAWQIAAMRCWDRNVLMLVTRQGGKSFTGAGLAIRTALLEAPALILILSPSLRQSGEFFRDKLINMYRALDGAPKIKRETSLQLELSNGSRIIALPGGEGTLRGYSSVRLAIFDEGSRIPDALFRSIRPMLAVSGGQTIALSTPWGQRGWFHSAVTEHSHRWTITKVPATEIPRISAEFLREEREMHGDDWVEQEYGLKFLPTTGRVFDLEAFQGMVRPRSEVGGFAW